MPVRPSTMLRTNERGVARKKAILGADPAFS
jgi:hypothetical protein